MLISAEFYFFIVLENDTHILLNFIEFQNRTQVFFISGVLLGSDSSTDL